MNFTPFPDFKTERLLLRRIETSDCEEILFLRTNKEVNKFIERPEHRKTKNIPEVIKFIEFTLRDLAIDKAIPWGITLKDNPKIIGTIGLWNFSPNSKVAEVGYDLMPDFQGKGIMTEALQKIIEFAFTNLNLEKIEAFTHHENVNSKSLLVKNGFELMENRKDPDNDSNSIFEIRNPSNL